MKVLQVNAVSGIRSTGRICTEIADYLNLGGHDGYLAYSSGLPVTKSYVVGTKLEAKLHALQSRIWGKQAYFSKRGTESLLKYMDGLKPDVVHLHNLHSNYINLPMFLGYLAKNDIPTVLTLHDCWFYTGKCTHYTLDGCNKWQQRCGGCPRLKKDNPSWFFDKTAQMLNDKAIWFGAIPRLAVVGVSDWITNEARKSILRSAKVITRIYNWIDLEVFRPVEAYEMKAKLGLEQKYVLLGVASGWSSAKGLEVFVEIARDLPENMALVLVGSLAKGTKMPKNITHINETHDKRQLAEFYSMADVYLNLSCEESFGKTTAEALACGTPAIVVNSTASPEVVGMDCGIVIEKPDPPLVWDAIDRVKQTEKKHYSSNCISRANSLFSPTINLKETVELYKLIKINDL